MRGLERGDFGATAIEVPLQANDSFKGQVLENPPNAKPESQSDLSADGTQETRQNRVFQAFRSIPVNR
jgi:hypothetical protein